MFKISHHEFQGKGVGRYSDPDQTCSNLFRNSCVWRVYTEGVGLLCGGVCKEGVLCKVGSYRASLYRVRTCEQNDQQSETITFPYPKGDVGTHY